MTKTLTEQWREGTLPEGYYYITSKKWGMLIDRYKDQINDCGHKWRGFDNCQGIVEEVLALVPDYMDCKGLIYDSINLADARKRIDELVSKTEQLEKRLEVSEKAHYKTLEQLRIATKALKDILNDGDDYWDKDKAQEALTKMKGVK